MSKKVDSKTGSLKSMFLTAAGLLAYGAVEAMKTGDTLVGALLLAGALGGILGHEILSQRQFAFEDEFAAALGDGETLAQEYEDLLRENEGEIKDALDNVLGSDESE